MAFDHTQSPHSEAPRGAGPRRILQFEHRCWSVPLGQAFETPRCQRPSGRGQVITPTGNRARDPCNLPLPFLRSARRDRVPLCRRAEGEARAGGLCQRRRMGRTTSGSTPIRKARRAKSACMLTCMEMFVHDARDGGSTRAVAGDAAARDRALTGVRLPTGGGSIAAGPACLVLTASASRRFRQATASPRRCSRTASASSAAASSITAHAGSGARGPRSRTRSSTSRGAA